ncbi:MAG: hypothetical protein K6C94_03900 [Candidatus Gastranaerophilales bacterium]|nr:hypothetical protein [Candidatus Gastranaerophilales bacterium]
MEFKFAKNVKILGLIFTLLSLIFVFYAACSQRGLYSDGSVYFLQLLNNISSDKFGLIFTHERARFFIQGLQELPVLLTGLIFVIKSKMTPATVYSLTLFLLPLVVLWWNFELTKRTKEYGIFFWSVFTYCVLILLYQIDATVETIIGVPLQFVLLNYLFGKINYTKADKIGIGFILLTMFGIYEHTFFIGLILFAGTFIAAFDETDEDNALVKICIGGASLAAASYSLFYVIFHNSAYSLSMLSIFTDFWGSALQLNLVFAILTVILSGLLVRREKALNAWQTILLVVIYSCLFYYMFSDLQTYLNPVMEGHLRSVVFWAVPLIFLGFVVYKYKTRNKEVENKDILINNALVPVLLCGICLTLWQMVHTYYWNQNVDFMLEQVQNCEDALYIPSEQEEISGVDNSDLRRYILHKNSSATQIIFDKNYTVTTLLLTNEEDDNDLDKNYRENLYYLPDDEKINLPPDFQVPVQNKYWNLRDAADALNAYNYEHGIHVKTEENEEEEEEK